MPSREPKHVSARRSIRVRRQRLLLASAILVGVGSLGAGSAIAAPPDLDTSFGEGGVVYTEFPQAGIPGDFAEAVAVQPDGKVVVAGHGGGGAAVARLNPDGSLDSTFAGDGLKIVGPLGRGASALDVALEGDGDVVLAGRTRGPEFGDESDFLVARLNADGSPDTGFGGDGVVTTDTGRFVSDVAYGVALAPDNDIIVAGQTGAGFSLARYETDGSLEQLFGDGGLVLAPESGVSTRYEDIEVQPDARILAGGRDVVTRYEPDGTVDHSFGANGSILVDHGVRALALDRGDRVVVGGSDIQDFRISRYDSEGKPDIAFNANADGRIFDDGHVNGVGLNDLAIDGEGQVVAVGFVFFTLSSTQAAVARFRPDGSADASFGPYGGTTYREVRIASGVALAPDGRIAVAGDSFTGEGGKVFATLRLEGGTAPNQPPETSLRVAQGPTSAGFLEIEFSGTDDFLGPSQLTFECKRNRSEWRSCASPKVYRKLRPGRYTISVRAIDDVQRDPTPAVVRVRVPERR